MQISTFQDTVTLIGTGTPTAAGVSTRSAQLATNIRQTLTQGSSSAGQINTWYDAERYLAGGSWTVTISGSPTGGTFTVSVTTGGNYVNGIAVASNTQTTAAIAYNAAASAVQTALRALSNVGGTLATVSGSAGGPYTVTFDSTLSPVSISAATGSFTGGSSPAISAVNGQVVIAGTAPTFGSAATTGGTLVQSTTIYAKYTYKNGSGETVASSEGTYAVPASGTSTNTVLLTAPALPTGATGINVYVGSTSGAESFLGTSAGNTFSITALPAAGAALPSPWNTTTLTTETINLASLTDPNGIALTFTGISGIHIENASPTSPLVVFGGGTFAGPQSSPSNAWIIPPALTINGVIVPTVLHMPAYAAGGAWKVFSGVNNTLRIGTYDPNGVVYGIVLPGVA